MSVIIRLQNLPWSANALDIRQYFHGLSIPEGGVHIVGGELGDAFIAFSTDEDARQAFNLNNGKIKGVQIKLMLSSRTEMQKVIEAARNQSLAAFMQTPRIAPANPVPNILPTAVPTAVPEVKKEEKDNNRSKEVKTEKSERSRDKRRSRSRSRERKERDRSRDRDRRDRRRRDRSRSRSRERRDRRRRDRSRSRDRTRSKDRDYHRGSQRSSEKSPPISQPKENQIVWEAPIQQDIQLQQPSAASILGAIPSLLAATAAKSLLGQQNAFQPPLRDTFNNQWAPNREPAFQLPERYPNDGRFNDNRNRMGNFETPNAFNNRSTILPNNRPTMNVNANHNNRFAADIRGGQSNLKNCCVQIHPFTGGYGEVRRFFQGLFIHNTGIKFVYDDYGKSTGVVYVRFAYSEGKAQALLRSGGVIRNQVVTVSHLDDDIFEQTIDRYHPNDEQDEFNGKPDTGGFVNKKSPFTTLLVEDLPNYTKEQDLLKMFSDYSLMSIILVNKPRKITLAYIKFSNPDDAKAALEAVNKHSVDGKPVTVKPCSDEEFEIVQREQGTFIEEPPKPNEPFKNSNVLFLSRLPLKTSDRDISDFFSDIGIMPTNIHMLTNSMGFVGDAYCEFANVKDAKAALEKNGSPLGTSIVLVKSVDRSEMEDVVGIIVEDDEDMNVDPFERRNQNEVNDINSLTDRRDLRDNMNKIGGGDMAGRFGDMGSMPNKMDFQSSEKMNPLNFPPRMPNMMRPMMGMNSMRPMFQPRNNFMPSGPRGQNFMGPRPRRFPPPHFQQPPMGGNNEEVFGPPGCTVLMENVPFKATVEEILEFFSGYEIAPDNILRRYNPNGKPSGESKVIFKNAEDAYQAVHEKQEQKIRDRTVFLTLC